VYELWYQNDRELQKKLFFLQRRLPLYGTQQAPPDFLRQVITGSLYHTLLGVKKSICISDRSGEFENLILFAAGHAHTLKLHGSQKQYMDTAHLLQEVRGAEIIFTAEKDTGFCIDLQNCCLYLHGRKLTPLRHGMHSIDTLWGMCQDRGGGEYRCDIWQFENGRVCSLDKVLSLSL